MKKNIFFTILIVVLCACGTSNVSNKQKDSKENLARQKFGIEVVNLSEDTKKKSGLSHGVLIQNVYSLYPANKAGILKGDIIIKLDNNNVLDLENLNTILEGYRHKYGQVTLGIVRDNKTQKFTLYLE